MNLFTKSPLQRRGIPDSPSFWAVLAALRFGLALLVFDGHISLVGFTSIAGRFMPPAIGHVAVLSFLLISGVSIGYSYRERPSGFYTRRFLRIYPLYFAALAFTQMVALIVPNLVGFPALSIHTAHAQTTVANLLFLQGIAAIPIPYNSPVWSLSLEAWLYILTPLLFRLSRLSLLAVIACALLAFGFAGGSWVEQVPAVYLFKWSWAWLIGFLLACDNDKRLCLAAGCVGAALMFFNHEFSTGLFANIAFFLAVLAMVLGANRLRLPLPAEKSADFLGDLSYPLYLFHLPIMILLFQRLGIRSEASFVIPVLIFVIAIECLYEKRLKPAFWQPLTYSLVRLLPANWSLLRSGRKQAPPVADLQWSVERTQQSA